MFRPHSDYIVLKPQIRSKSSIIEVITKDTDRGTIGEIGTIMAIGSGKLTKSGHPIPMESKVGDKVMVGGQGLAKLMFPKVIHNGEECIVIQEADIVCVLESE